MRAQKDYAQTIDSLPGQEFAKFDRNTRKILADMFVDMSIDAGEKLSTIKEAGLLDQLNKITAQEGGVEQQGTKSYKVAVGEKANSSWESEVYRFDEGMIAANVYDIRYNQAERGRDLVKVGTMPYLFRKLFGLTGDVFVSNSHLYANIVSKKDAITDKRYVAGDGVDYHNLGEEKIVNAILQFQNPLAIMESLKDFDTPRLAVVLDEKRHDGNNLIAVLELYAKQRAYGEAHERSHVLITIYEKNSLPDYIEKTAKKDRVMYVKKGVAADTLADLQLVGDISDATLKANIAEFLKKVNKFKVDNKIDYKIPVDSDTSSQWQTAKDNLVHYREALRDQKNDTRVMEKEFARLARVFETQARRSGKKDVDISDLKTALKAEAKKHRAEQKVWEAEFNRLLRAYETAGRQIERLEETIARQRQAAKDKVESRRKTEMRHKIIRFKEKLQSTLQRPTENSYVPVDLISAMVDVCELIDTDSPLYKADGSLNKAQQARELTKERLLALKEESLTIIFKNAMIKL